MEGLDIETLKGWNSTIPSGVYFFKHSAFYFKLSRWPEAVQTEVIIYGKQSSDVAGQGLLFFIHGPFI